MNAAFGFDAKVLIVVLWLCIACTIIVSSLAYCSIAGRQAIYAVAHR